MSKQIQNGKAFEYACANIFASILSNYSEVEIVKDSSFFIAQSFYEQMTEEERAILDKGAKAATQSLLKLEPRLLEENSKLLIAIQPDNKGQAGDVRDVIFLRKEVGWSVGISVKHNHEAVKHSRLSATLDFGSKWFGKPCSKEYFQEITPVFEKLNEYKLQNLDWNEIDKKAETVYLPILRAFINEIKRLDRLHPEVVPAEIIEYLIGRNDFYKVILHSQKRVTQLQAFSLHGTLNENSLQKRAEISIPRIKLPHRIYDIYLKHGSNNTVILALDQGWELSFRIHSASTKVESSLKFDIQIIGQPSLYTHYESWE